MKTKVFSQYRPELTDWIDDFDRMREESTSKQLKVAKEKKSIGKHSSVKPNEGRKQILNVMKKLETEYKIKQKRTESTNGDQPDVSAEFIRQIHSYACPPQSESSATFKYNCPDCKFAYKTNKKSNFDYHFARCNKKPHNNLKCPIYGGVYTYDTLRQHLRHFASGKHITTNKHHGKYTPSDHLLVLNGLKELKKK